VLDVGGGSAEIVRGTPAGMEARRSLDVGAVRLTERCFSPGGTRLPIPSAEQVADAERTVDAALDALDFDLSAEGRPLPLLGASGTARVLGYLASPSDPLAFIPAADLRTWRDRLLGLTPAETLALNPDVLAGREDVFAAGVLIVERVLERFGLEGMWPSPRGLRHGLALDWARRRGRRGEAR
jgi:exopolyphosphatase/guanosine-5'-triphosphate,3'-diphosphate pyrophosphatase